MKNIKQKFASALELIRFRQNVAKANKRIKRLEAAGLEPKILTYVKGFLDGENRFRIPRKLNQLDYNNIKNVVERFLGVHESKVRFARKADERKRQNFHKKISNAFGDTLSQSAERVLYDSIGDIDIKSLLRNYTYEEILITLQQLENAQLPSTKDFISQVLQRNIDEVVEDYLKGQGVLQGTDVPFEKLNNMYYYVQLAKAEGVQEAVNEYEQNLREVD